MQWGRSVIATIDEIVPNTVCPLRTACNIYFPGFRFLSTRKLQILIVATSAPELKGYPTGLWLEEIAAPYFIFMEAGYEITIASPAGGPIP